MSTKPIILSSFGLQNLNLNMANANDEFHFIFGKQDVSMNKIYAQFISPTISQLQKADPTINSINVFDIFNKIRSSNMYNFEELFSEDTLSLFERISSGLPIDINEVQSKKLRFLSMILGNNELFHKINECFPNELDESSIDQHLKELLTIYCFSRRTQKIEYQRYINFFASHFYCIDQNKLVHLPKSILYSIISSKELVIESEDSLFNFIHLIFNGNDIEEEEEYDEGNDDEESYDIISFYEYVEFRELSENKFREFLNEFDSNEITIELWRKLSLCFYINYNSTEGKSEKRYKTMAKRKENEFKYDEDEKNSLRGIIHYLTEKSGGNVASNGTIALTTCSVNSSNFVPKYVVDLDDNTHYFQSSDAKGTWIKYDFKERSVRPTFYTIRTRHDWGKSGGHLSNWVIEGSNSGSKNDWKILDSRENVMSLDDKNAMCTFKIQTDLKSGESFRFLRIRITGPNTDGKYFMYLSALEYFGTLFEAIQ